MPPRNRELPEGTDHIINGAMERGTSASTGPGGGFVGSGQADDTGGTAGTSRRGKAVTQIKENAASLRDQAPCKPREYAVDGKVRAAQWLGEFSEAVTESARTTNERLGARFNQDERAGGKEWLRTGRHRG